MPRGSVPKLAQIAAAAARHERSMLTLTLTLVEAVRVEVDAVEVAQALTSGPQSAHPRVLFVGRSGKLVSERREGGNTHRHRYLDPVPVLLPLLLARREQDGVSWLRRCVVWAQQRSERFVSRRGLFYLLLRLQGEVRRSRHFHRYEGHCFCHHHHRRRHEGRHFRLVVGEDHYYFRLRPVGHPFR